MQNFGAPWGKTLTLTSALSTVFLMLVAVSLGRSGSLMWLVLLIPAGALPFVIRGYTVGDGRLGIRRLFWTTYLSLEGLKSAQFQLGAMSKSLRTCGNGGLYSITGWFWSRKLGFYRAWVTDLNRCVVLTFEDGRTCLVSPSDPASFVSALCPGSPADPVRGENG